MNKPINVSENTKFGLDIKTLIQVGGFLVIMVTGYMNLKNDVANLQQSIDSFVSKQEVESIEDVALDFAESALHDNIKNGKEASIIFYLKTKGKNRGYVERQEITGKEGEPIQITGFTYVKPDEDTTND